MKKYILILLAFIALLVNGKSRFSDTDCKPGINFSNVLLIDTSGVISSYDTTGIITICIDEEVISYKINCPVKCENMFDFYHQKPSIRRVYIVEISDDDIFFHRKFLKVYPIFTMDTEKTVAFYIDKSGNYYFQDEEQMLVFIK
ncbi:MAG: hypothetical protein JXB17_11975 [Bacteroidales bacterium]|nr:hypothetical protein [Bacteroidales bacterium]